MAEWPDFYPEDCPPDDAENATGTLYRLVSEEPVPEGNQYTTAYHRDAFSDEDDCLRAALSCFAERSDIVELRKAVPRLNDQLVAEVDLEPELGKMKQTRKPSHHSLWVREDHYEDFHTRCEVVE